MRSRLTGHGVRITAPSTTAPQRDSGTASAQSNNQKGTSAGNTVAKQHISTALKKPIAAQQHKEHNSA
jgi:hypothetical protein